MKDKKNILICGSTFGKFYLRSLLKSSEYKVDGLLTNGSLESHRLADEYGLTLYTNIRSIPFEKYDLACVVIRSAIVGGYGSEIVKELLNHNVSVIQEQPVHIKEIMENYKIAKKHHLFYKVNTFYPYIKPVCTMLDTIQQLKSITPIRHIDATCGIQVLFPFVDVLREIIGGLTPYKVAYKKIFKKGIYTLVGIEIKDVPVTIKIQNQIDLKDPDNYSYILQSFNILTDIGNLELTDINGYLIWSPQKYFSSGFIKESNILSSLGKSQSKLLYSIENKTNEDIYNNIWPESIKNFFEKHNTDITNKIIKNRDIQSIVSVCELWKDISESIGNPEVIEKNL
ncbi:MAG: Gfo/Idh/MocA family oxidoreductase [Peptostreptococcus sp.]|uniref:Gfo/Idh/MocA family oxidoreductase n=1 Tax=Peptostreptococcus sp. TaxID=1262 RepID=UPI000763EB5E|nr:Gfo/Idh/MocA family oxidoreductase [Peptostreptococcus sp.]KXA00375.1 thiazolinyl imide reductase [Anaerococcus hydrogenalis]MDU5350745.1 Gfo/Idh/MocA family oxidoreductase [Peptostreptococcus sp.]MDU5890365.1 Gfo/Idh/MocA family oxidoreductase [Peptostreptococcus sp.]MDU6064410.1 Gfo/Idh/MocA family oxidoreductase [Anaerococcus sp.]